MGNLIISSFHYALALIIFSTENESRRANPTDFAGRLNSLLNAADIFPIPHPDVFREVGVFLKQDHTTGVGSEFSELISPLKHLLQRNEILGEMYSNFLETFETDAFLSNPRRSFDSNRREIFKANVIKIAEHNALARAGKVGYEKAINRFSEMTPEEFSTRDVIRLNSKLFNISTLIMPDLDKNITTTDIPGTEFNWVTLGYVTPVKDQFQEICRSSVLFASVAAVESSHLLHNLGNQFHEELDLSEQELLDCMNGWPGFGGCLGQETPYIGFEYMAQFGISSESEYPYKGSNGIECKAHCYPRIAKILKWGMVASFGSENILKQAVRQYGPLIVTIDSHGDFFHYHSGVYEGVTNDQGS